MTELPLSIVEAVYCFLISVSVRNLRGDNHQHKTMLIHCTRLLVLQERLLELVDDLVDDIYNAMVTTPLGGDNKHLREIETFLSSLPEDSREVGSIWDGLKDAVSRQEDTYSRLMEIVRM